MRWRLEIASHLECGGLRSKSGGRAELTTMRGVPSLSANG